MFRRVLISVAALAVGAVLGCGEVDPPEQSREVGSESATTSSPTSTAAAASSSTAAPVVEVTGFGGRRQLEGRNLNGDPIPVYDATALAVSASGLIAIGNERGELYLFDSAGDLLDQNLSAHGGRIAGAAFVGETDTLVTAGGDGYASTWADPSDLSSPDAMTTPFGGVALAGVAASATGSRLVIASGDRRVGLTVVADQKVLPVSDPARLRSVASVLAVVPSPAGTADLAAVAGTDNGSLALIEGAETGGGAASIVFDGSSPAVPSLAATVDGTAILWSDGHGVRLVDLASSATYRVAAVADSVETTAVAIGGPEGALRPLLAIAGRAGPVDESTTLWLLADADGPALEAHGFGGEVEELGFLPDGWSMVIATSDYVVLQALRH